jgi:hypothetical protein
MKDIALSDAKLGRSCTSIRGTISITLLPAPDFQSPMDDPVVFPPQAATCRPLVTLAGP